MALYAFDGTWNKDEVDEVEDTNVVRFREVYAGADFEYLSGVGTRFGAIGYVTPRWQRLGDVKASSCRRRG